MVHPSELFRTNSNETRTFSAPRVAVNEKQLDCGLTNLPILNRCCDLHKFAKPRLFLSFLSIVGFLQGVTLTYFRETAKIWGKHYNISPDNTDWLIYTNEFFVGIFALGVAYYGNKIHRISWIGGLTIFQSISSGILLVPELYRKNYKDQMNMTEIYLCGTNSASSANDTDINYIAIAVLIIFQILFALATISFICHGITYLDDNSAQWIAPGYIGIALASRELGKQAGLYLSWIPEFIKVNAVFISPIWLTLASVTFISGVFIAMFPRSMPSALVQSLAASLIDLASGHEIFQQKEVIDGFFKTLSRLLRNPILMVNIFCAVLMQSGLINFNIFEKYFNQSRFQIAYDTDRSYTQFTTNILKQPLVAVSIIAAGYLIAKIKLQLSSLVKWNIAATILIIIFFGSTAFLQCEPNTKYGQMLHQPMCIEEDCGCDFKEFQPVCMNSRTYYSPCFAGCVSVKEVNTRKIYQKCGCHNKDEADEGPCNAKTCDIFYALSQVNRIFTSALLGSILVTNLMINMRCILRRDKATALGLEATFTGLISYLPVKAIYGAAAENFCIFPKESDREDGVCRLFSNNFATFLSFCTIGFMILSLVLAVILLFLLKLKPVNEEDDEEHENEPVELEEIHDTSHEENRLMSEHQKSNDEADSAQNKRKSGSANSVESMTESLLEMENVGDDHDSIDSASYLDEQPTRSRLIESDL